MLDLRLQAEVAEAVWSGLDATALAHDELTPPEGAPPVAPAHSRRVRERTPLGGRAVAVRGETRLGVLLRDVSFQGIGFAAPVQLFPREVVAIELHPDLCLTTVVRRCRRHGPKCYVCGADFDPEPLTRADFRELTSLLKGPL